MTLLLAPYQNDKRATSQPEALLDAMKDFMEEQLWLAPWHFFYLTEGGWGSVKNSPCTRIFYVHVHFSAMPIASIPFISIYIIIQGVSKKLSFTELSICRFATNIISISSQLAALSPNAQFGKTQFFFKQSVYVFLLVSVFVFLVMCAPLSMSCGSRN